VDRLLSRRSSTLSSISSGPHSTPAGLNEPESFMQHIMDNSRRHQAAGELTVDVAAAHLLLAQFAAACAPMMLPQMRRICGVDPGSEMFIIQCARLLAGSRPPALPWVAATKSKRARP
jgi:hypothetical protein